MKKSLLKLIEEAIDDAKGENKAVLDLRKEPAYCDYMVIATGTSDRHVNALSDRIREAVKETLAQYPLGVEGEREASWILMDYGDVVVHLFQPETRDQYRLEDLWKDAALPKRRGKKKVAVKEL